MRFVARAALATALLAGIYLMAIAIVGGLGLTLYVIVANGYGGAMVAQGIVALLLLSLGLGRAFWAVHKAGDSEPTGVTLTPEEQPRLWSEVREIADGVGTRPPDEIRLLPVLNAAVSEDARLLGLLGGRRVMYVGAPLLMGVTRLQLRAVLAHELGHYSHRHTALSVVTYRGQETLRHLVEQLGVDSFVGRMFAAYGRLFMRVSHKTNRRQEIEADGLSYRLAGREASASMMRELPALDLAWQHFLERYAFPIHDARPQDLFEGFAQFLASPQRRSELDEIRGDPPEPPPSPYDSHPSTSLRIEFFESLPPDGTGDDGIPAVTLLNEPGEVLRSLETWMFRETTRVARSWEWISEKIGTATVRERASYLVRANAEVGMGAPTLHDALLALGRGGARQLVRPLVPQDLPPAEATRLARSLVEAAVAAALVKHCNARFAHSWDSDTVLLDADGKQIDVRALVDSITDHGSAAAVSSLLRDVGVPLAFSVHPTEADTLRTEIEGSVEPRTRAVAVCMKWPRMFVLVVADSALILKRLSVREGAVAMFRHLKVDGYLNAMHYVAAMPLARLVDDSRADVYTWDKVERVTVNGRNITVAAAGRVRRSRVKTHATAGDVLGTLGQHLGDRLTVA